MSCFTANVQSLAYQKTMTPINKMTVASDVRKMASVASCYSEATCEKGILWVYLTQSEKQQMGSALGLSCNT